MADITYGEGNDTIDLSKLPQDQWQSNIFAGGGNDTIIGASSFTGVVIGGAGNDSISNAAIGYFSSKDVVVNLAEGWANDSLGGRDTLTGVTTVHGGGFDDTIVGSANADWLAGNGGNDSIDGGGGDDFFYEGAGNDTLNGGNGDDTVYYEGLLTRYQMTFSADGKTLSVKDLDTGYTDALQNIEKLLFNAGPVDVAALKYKALGNGYFRQADWSWPGLTSALLGMHVGTAFSDAYATGDFNGDGISDVLISYFEFVPAGETRNAPTPSLLMLLEGRADGTLVDASSLLPGSGTYDANVRKIRTGDFNSDGWLDFVIASSYEDGRIINDNAEMAAPQYVFLQGSDGKFTRSSLNLSVWGHSATSGDFNGDGKDDFYVGGFVTNNGDSDPKTSAIYLQSSTPGQFSKIDIDGATQSTSEFVDFNGDGRADLVTLGGWEIQVRLQDAQGNLGAPIRNILPYIRIENGVTWQLTHTQFRISKDSNGAEFMDHGYHDTQLADLDHDGKPEIVAYRMGNDMNYVDGVLSQIGAAQHLEIDVLTPNPDGTLTQKNTVFAGWDYHAAFFFFQLIDFNQDGHLDIFLSTASPSGSPTLYLNDGTGNFQRVPDALMPIGGPNGKGYDLNSVAGDFNADGLSDVLIYPMNPWNISANDSLASLHLGTARIDNGPGFQNPAAAPGFNETYYLRTYPDAAAAVSKGDYATGLDHYLQVGRAKGYFGFAAYTWVHGTAAAETITLREGDERADGQGENDTLIGGAGNDTLDGGSGTDTVLFTGNRAQYQLSKVGNGYQVQDSVAGRDGTDALSNIERLHFTDSSIAFDSDVTASKSYRLYKAAFDRTPDLGGLGYWIKEVDNGKNFNDVATGFIGSAEFKSIYGANSTDQTFVRLLYNHVLARDPDQGGYDYWLNQMSHGMTRETVLINFSESAENIANVAEIIAVGIPYTEWQG